MNVFDPEVGRSPIGGGSLDAGGSALRSSLPYMRSNAAPAAPSGGGAPNLGALLPIIMQLFGGMGGQQSGGFGGIGNPYMPRTGFTAGPGGGLPATQQSQGLGALLGPILALLGGAGQQGSAPGGSRYFSPGQNPAAPPPPAPAPAPNPAPSSNPTAQQGTKPRFYGNPRTGYHEYVPGVGDTIL